MASSGSRDLVLNFGTPVISLEWLKVQTLNFASGLNVRDIKQKIDKLAKSGREIGHVSYFSNFGTPLISLEWLKIQILNFARGMNVRDKKPKNVK